jgi:hypothetical protein
MPKHEVEKTAKKVDVEFKLGELTSTVRELKRDFDDAVKTLNALVERVKRLENSQSLHSHYIVISKKQLFAMLGTILGGLGSLIYYLYLIVTGNIHVSLP